MTRLTCMDTKYDSCLWQHFALSSNTLTNLKTAAAIWLASSPLIPWVNEDLIGVSVNPQFGSYKNKMHSFYQNPFKIPLINSLKNSKYGNTIYELIFPKFKIYNVSKWSQQIVMANIVSFHGNISHLEEDTCEFTKGVCVDIVRQPITLVHLMNIPTDRNNMPIIVNRLPICQNQKTCINTEQ